MAAAMLRELERQIGVYVVTVFGPPRTKKTHNQFVQAGRRTVMVPSQRWREWARDARIAVGTISHFTHFHPPIVGPGIALNCAALFYRDANRGDLVGYLQGLADLLEKRGVIPNDKQIAQWDGSRLRKDALNPRVEVVLTIIAPEVTV